jgi:hypothetical protein
MRYTPLHLQLKKSLEYLEFKLRGYDLDIENEAKLPLRKKERIYTPEKKEKLKQDVAEMKAALSGIWAWRKGKKSNELFF